RMPVSDIPTYSNNTSGVIVMRLSDGAKIVNFSTAEAEPDIPEEAAEAEETVSEGSEENEEANETNE
ncbi:MAG: hypothetical protein KBS76_01715, partial [Ruminococcus sp.]|nr:hypothetical protein [Candidatus Apopatosoma intestinale]